jgi:hypothetical protein
MSAALVDRGNWVVTLRVRDMNAEVLSYVYLK